MNIVDMFRNGPQVNIYEKRMQNPDQCEWVVWKEDLAAWRGYLTDQLGKPSKSVDEKPDTEQQRITAPFGGIYQEQTLFVLDEEKERVVAMFWPWQDSMHVTIKLFCHALAE